MKRLIDFCLLLLMVFWGSNAWADKTMTFSATSPTNDCNLTKLNVPAGSYRSIEEGGITLTITAAIDDNASWNTADAGSNHGQTIALKTNAKITISSSSAEMKITKIVFNFETHNKGYFAESSTTGGTLAPTEATSYVTTQTWSSDQGASSVSLTSNNTKNKAYITSIDITYKTSGLDNHTVQAYPYTWNFTDENLWEKSESQFVSEIWTNTTDTERDEWRNTGHEPTDATGYDVDLLRGLHFTGHVCADRKNKCVFLPPTPTATITIPSLHEGQNVKIFTYTGVGILPTTNLKVIQERRDNIEIYKVTQDGDAILTIDPNGTNLGVWISQISVLDAAPVLTMTTPENNATGVDPNTLTSIMVTSDKPLWAYDVNGTKTLTEQTIKATLTSDDENNNMVVTATFTAGEAGVKELNFTLPQGKQLESTTTYTLNIPANVIMETSGTGNKNCSFTFSTKGLNYLGAYNGSTKIEANPYTVSTLDNNQVAFAFEENFEKTADFNVTVYSGTTVKSYTKDSKECVISADNKRLYVPVTLTAGKHYSIKITAGSLKDATAGSTLKNNQIVLNLISSMKGINLSMTTPYNQYEAPLTTRIILSAKDNDGINANIKDNVEATLVGKSADGSLTHDIGTVTGIANSNKLVFTPKEGQQLRPNYTYTLKLSKKAELKDVEGGMLDDDTFVFTTAKVIGNAPIVESTSPAAESTIKVEDVQPTTSKQIKIKFNEDIQLLDGALIFCRPMGGSESYTSIEYYSARSNNYNSIHADGNKLWFEYSGQHLFYGMRYEVIIPTYAIVGNGGQPMEKNFKFYFETPKSAKASDSRKRKDVYTWDFTNISPTTFDKINESVTAGNTYWVKTEDDKTLKYGSSRKSSFAQGQEIKAGASNNTIILPELKGLLFNLVKDNSGRFQIVCKNKSEAKGNTYLFLNGGTHYVTIQSVPAKAMVYIEHNGNEMFNLNTLGVESIKTIPNSNNNLVSVYQLGNTAKDLTFCVKNCKLYRIAIVKDNKTIGSAEKNYIKYATYSQSYPVDYNLNASLNGTAVTAYSVSAADYQSNATFVKFTELPNNQSDSGEGVILKTSGKLGESHPIFTTDVNNTTPEKPASNALVGTGDEETKFDAAKKEGCQNYILTTTYFHLDKNENQSGGVIDGNQQCFYKWVKGNVKSNLAYLKLKNPNNTNAKTVIYLDWFGDTMGIHGMTAPSQVTSGKTYYTLDGRKVTSPTQKGIYIINGKKIIIK
jgi:hypothetical protein